METPYTSYCTHCHLGTWYETEQQCHRSFKKVEECNLGHLHDVLDDEEMIIMERCTGTLIPLKLVKGE